MGVTLTRAQRKLMLLTAVAYMRALNERRHMYEEECERDARNGYRAHYCIHGTNQWTDYDNICGPCEDGYTDRELALMEAHAAVSDYMRRLRMYQDFTDIARANGVDARSLAEHLATWLEAPLEILTTHKRPTRNLP